MENWQCDFVIIFTSYLDINRKFFRFIMVVNESVLKLIETNMLFQIVDNCKRIRNLIKE